MMGESWYSDSIIKNSPLSVRAFCTSGTHRTICPHKKQAILAYANLKYGVNDF
jgi:hypothetical protein